MREVSTQTVALVLDGLTHRALPVAPFLVGLGLDAATLADPDERIDWEVWATLLDRIEAAIGGPEEMERFFVPRAGQRTRHPFVALGKTFLTIDDLYRLLARWGMRRQLRVMDARFERLDDRRARVIMTIEAQRRGSAATLRFTAGIMRALPGLQGLPDAGLRTEITPHRAVYDLELPNRPSLLARARHVVRVVAGAEATLNELAQQSREIHEKNLELESRIAALAAAEEELRERDAWLQLALDAGRVGIWSVDVATGERRYSAGMFRMVGLDPRTATVDEARALILADDLARVDEHVRTLVTSGMPLDVELRTRTTDARTLWLRITGQRIESPTGVKLLGTATDVTERRALDTQLRLADRLISAGTLAAGVAHEINNPLTYVMGNVELLRSDLASFGTARARLEEPLADVLDGLVRIREVVRDLRTLSRPHDEGVSRVMLGDVVSAALRIVGHELRHRTRVIYTPSSTPLGVLGNESRLGQVVTNLLLNAAQAMPARPIDENLVTVRLLERGESEVGIEVHDNGLGIAADRLERIFDPFYTTKAIGEGSGLGLAVCQGIVRALGGRIEVDSEVGRGTTFRVLLPRDDGEAAVAPPAPIRPALAGRRVLVIDDEPLVRRSLARMLRAEGCEVLEADGGREGLTLALSEPRLDAVLCDLMMPDVPGMAVFRAIEHQRPELARRTAFLSGGAVTEDARTFLASTERPYLEKPFRLADLRVTLTTLAARTEP